MFLRKEDRILDVLNLEDVGGTVRSVNGGSHDFDLLVDLV
jgi:hypothetical protein